jgi:hypothetical protein
MGFYSRTERRGNRHVAVETERERAWVCVHCEKMRMVSIENGRLELLVCELLFTTLFIQETYLNCEKGERKKRKRKKDHKVNEIEQQNNRGTLGDINAATTFRIHFPHNVINLTAATP